MHSDLEHASRRTVQLRQPLHRRTVQLRQLLHQRTAQLRQVFCQRTVQLSWAVLKCSADHIE